MQGARSNNNSDNNNNNNNNNNLLSLVHHFKITTKSNDFETICEYYQNNQKGRSIVSCHLEKQFHLACK